MGNGRDSFEQGAEDPNQVDRSRRRFVSRGLELLSAVPLVWLLGKNFNNNRAYYAVNASRALMDERPEVVQEFAGIHEGFQGSLDRLASAYGDAYHNSELEYGTWLGMDGEMKSGMRSVTKWREPEDVPKNDVVSGWKGDQDKLAERAGHLVSGEIIEGAKFDRLSIDEERAGKLGQGALSVGIYGASVLALLGYEEAAAALSYSGREQLSWGDRVRAVNSPKQIRRRSFIKIGAALLGAGVAKKIGDYNGRKLREGEVALAGELDSAKTRLEESAEDSFKRYFEVGSGDLVGRVSESVQLARTTLEGGVEDEGVRAALQDVVKTGEVYAGGLRQYFDDGVPADLGRVSNYADITSTVTEASRVQAENAGSGAILEGLGVAGTMAALIIPAEIINSKLG